MNFLWPSKPEQIQNPDKFIELWKSMGTLQNWGVQLKKNGCRCIPIVRVNTGSVLFDRHGKTLTMGLEKDWSILQKIFIDAQLDGELIGRKQGEVSNRLYLWDAPVIRGISKVSQSYQERHNALRNTFLQFAFAKNHDVFQTAEWEYIEFPQVTIGISKIWKAEDWRELIKAVKYNGTSGENEGLVFKDLTHTMDWSIVKTREIKNQLKFLLKYWDRK